MCVCVCVCVCVQIQICLPVAKNLDHLQFQMVDNRSSPTTPVWEDGHF